MRIETLDRARFSAHPPNGLFSKYRTIYGLRSARMPVSGSKQAVYRDKEVFANSHKPSNSAIRCIEGAHLRNKSKMSLDLEYEPRVSFQRSVRSQPVPESL